MLEGSGDLPLELQFRLLHLLEGNMHQVTRCNLQFKRIGRNLRQLAFQVFAALNGLLKREPYLLTDYTLEIPRFEQVSLNPRRTDLQRLTITRDNIFLVEPLAQTFRDQLAIAVRHPARLVDVDA